MNTVFEELERKVRELPRHEKAALARTLIDDLDTVDDHDIDRIWDEEARRRLALYRRGDLEAVSGAEAIAKARQRLK